mmetsp:Transcript_15801/g.32045  ORF Transcript_15801/g.32045 Transcript_15801/m.32045 type:complete len:84 (+) Transcript_15801:33-284(+)
MTREIFLATAVERIRPGEEDCGDRRGEGVVAAETLFVVSRATAGHLREDEDDSSTLPCKTILGWVVVLISQRVQQPCFVWVDS